MTKDEFKHKGLDIATNTTMLLNVLVKQNKIGKTTANKIIKLLNDLVGELNIKKNKKHNIMLAYSNIESIYNIITLRMIEKQSFFNGLLDEILESINFN